MDDEFELAVELTMEDDGEVADELAVVERMDEDEDDTKVLEELAVVERIDEDEEVEEVTGVTVALLLELLTEDEVDSDDVGVVKEDVNDELVELVDEEEDVVEEEELVRDEDVVEVCEEVEVELLLWVLVLETVELVVVTVFSW